MKIIADENIPYAKEAFADLGEVSTLPGRQMQNSDLQNCDCLLVRSVTRVNKTLLKNTPVKFVASATIGTDHIDLEYLQQQNIGFSNAPGCNAESASEYMINALFELSQKKGFNPFELTAGIVGHGNVGSRVKKKLDALGINTLVNDPPLQDSGDDSINYVSLQTILHECDFITCHVPLTRDGDHPTFHLLNETRLNELAEDTILFNAARGPVIDNEALSALLTKRRDLTIFLDTWEGEPVINQTLLKLVDFATPHIAGYSVEGKLRGTQMILEAAGRYFEKKTSWSMCDHLPQKQTIQLSQKTNASLWPELFKSHYSIETDHQRLLALSELPDEQLANEFDLLRKNYPARYEYNQYLVEGISDKTVASQIEGILFNLK
ncbi:MAG: 4-phosphoerythronate dehydrogenase [Gammaproteobacteria bacterium]|jgi:erythronate-4-phosphate dehydrogenase|nr:4-phosphoerythronate dehydrogenase [Gammaproteobacteria bacterium]